MINVLCTQFASKSKDLRNKLQLQPQLKIIYTYIFEKANKKNYKQMLKDLANTCFNKNKK